MTWPIGPWSPTEPFRPCGGVRVELTQEQRLQGIGASEIAQAVGRGYAPKGKTPEDCLREFIDRKVLGVDFEGNRATRFGCYNEAFVTDEYWRERPRLEVEYIAPGWHPKHPWAFASPDRLVKVDGKPAYLIDIKTSGFGWKGSIPEYYRLQGVAQQAIFGLPVRFVVMNCGSKAVDELPIQYDPEEADALFTVAHETWKRIVELRVRAA